MFSITGWKCTFLLCYSTGLIFRGKTTQRLNPTTSLTVPLDSSAAFKFVPSAPTIICLFQISSPVKHWVFFMHCVALQGGAGENDKWKDEKSNRLTVQNHIWMSNILIWFNIEHVTWTLLDVTGHDSLGAYLKVPTGFNIWRSDCSPVAYLQ